MKRSGVAAVLLLFALSAFASNFRGADQVYVPIAGHAGGSSGTFITDVFIANLSGDSVDVKVIYVPLNPNENGQTPILEEIPGKIVLRAHERKALRDIFVNSLGKQAASNPLGMLVFSGCRANTSCGSETQDADGFSENFRPISVQTRIYQIKDPGANPPTTGQLFTGIPWYHLGSELQANVGLDKVFITGLTHTGGAGQAGTFRANIGVVNASEYSRTEIVFRLYQGTLSEADKKGEAVRTLGPLGNNQYGFNALFPGITGEDYFVTVEQRNSTGVGGLPPWRTCVLGCPGFIAYGSVLDNISGDATTMEAQYMKEMDPAALEILYPSGGGKGPLRRLVRH